MIVMSRTSFIFVSVSYWKSTICYRRIVFNISPDWSWICLSFFFLGLNFFVFKWMIAFSFWAPVIPYGILFLAAALKYKIQCLSYKLQKTHEHRMILYYSIVRAFYWTKVIKYILIVLFLGSFY